MDFTCQHSDELARSRTCASLHDKGKIHELVGRYGCPHARLVYCVHSLATENLDGTPFFCVVCWRITLVCRWQLGSVSIFGSEGAVGHGHVAWRLTWQAVESRWTNKVEDTELCGTSEYLALYYLVLLIFLPFCVQPGRIQLPLHLVCNEPWGDDMNAPHMFPLASMLLLQSKYRQNNEL